jgi:hypothetical protein
MRNKANSMNSCPSSEAGSSSASRIHQFLPLQQLADVCILIMRNYVNSVKTCF